MKIALKATLIQESNIEPLNNQVNQDIEMLHFNNYDNDFNVKKEGKTPLFNQVQSDFTG